MTEETKATNGVGETKIFMDNPSYRNTEPPRVHHDVNIPLQPRDKPPATMLNTTSSTTGIGGGTVCKPEVCRRARMRYRQAPSSDSPWHRRKTIALLLCLVLFVIWAVAYGTCSGLGVL